MGWRENFASIGGHPCFVDITGQTFGLFTATSRAENDDSGNARWHCRCSVCGGSHVLIGTQLRSRARKTCPDQRRPRDGGRDGGRESRL